MGKKEGNQEQKKKGGKTRGRKKKQEANPAHPLVSCYIVGYVWRIYKYFIKLCAALASFCERAGICLCGMMMRLELGSPLLQRSTTRRHQDLAEPKPRPIPLPSPLMIIKASCEARRALWLIDGWMSFWLASFHCVVIINSRGHILFIGKRIFANVIVIFLAQLSFVNCGLAERVPFCVCVPFVFCVWVCVCVMWRPEMEFCSHTHTFPLVVSAHFHWLNQAASSRGGRMPLTGLVFHK